MTSSYVYCLFDMFANSYSPVFESRNDRTAVRDVSSSLKNMSKRDLDTFLGDNQLLCLCKLEKENNDEHSELRVSIVDDGSRVVDWPDTFGREADEKEEVDG